MIALLITIGDYHATTFNVINLFRLYVCLNSQLDDQEIRQADL